LSREDFYRRKISLERALSHVEDPIKKELLVFENLTFGSNVLEREDKKRKITILYDSAFVKAFKIENDED
jgi:ABC-type transport system involved in cytochrome c biogenesis ATPase subunit